MTEKRIIYQNSDGGVSVIIPFLGCGLTINRSQPGTCLRANLQDRGRQRNRRNRSRQDLWFVDAADLTDSVGQSMG